MSSTHVKPGFEELRSTVVWKQASRGVKMVVIGPALKCSTPAESHQQSVTFNNSLDEAKGRRCYRTHTKPTGLVVCYLLKVPAPQAPVDASPMNPSVRCPTDVRGFQPCSIISAALRIRARPGVDWPTKLIPTVSRQHVEDISDA
jgi:hypothetical protein